MPNSTENGFRERLQALLDRRGWRQKDLADAMGITQQALYSIISKGNPKMTTIDRIAEALGCRPRELMR